MAVTEGTGTEIVELSAAEAMALIGRAGVGRVAVTASALPAILVVRYERRGGQIVFAPTSPHPPAALQSTVVAFETSGTAAGAGTWSVGVTGIAVPVAGDQLRLFSLTPTVVGGFRFA